MQKNWYAQFILYSFFFSRRLQLLFSEYNCSCCWSADNPARFCTLVLNELSDIGCAQTSTAHYDRFDGRQIRLEVCNAQLIVWIGRNGDCQLFQGLQTTQWGCKLWQLRDQVIGTGECDSGGRWPADNCVNILGCYRRWDGNRKRIGEVILWQYAQQSAVWTNGSS